MNIYGIKLLKKGGIVFLVKTNSYTHNNKQNILKVQVRFS